MPCFIVSLSASLAPDAALSCELYTLIEIKKRLPTPSPRADDAEEVLLYRADGKYLRTDKMMFEKRGRTFES